jgi:hypothetical protein
VTADDLYRILTDEDGSSEVFREGRPSGPPSLYRIWRFDMSVPGWGEWVDMRPDAPEWAEVARRIEANGDAVSARPIDRPWDGVWCRLTVEPNYASAIHRDS